MARFAALCAATPIHKLQKIPKRRFTNVSFGIFHNLDQLLANRSKMTLSIWIFGGTITLYSQNILSNSLYQRQKASRRPIFWMVTSFLLSPIITS